jgi:hypothetical protein
VTIQGGVGSGVGVVVLGAGGATAASDPSAAKAIATVPGVLAFTGAGYAAKLWSTRQATESMPVGVNGARAIAPTRATP